MRTHTQLMMGKCKARERERRRESEGERTRKSEQGRESKGKGGKGGGRRHGERGLVSFLFLQQLARVVARPHLRTTQDLIYNTLK